MKAELVLAEGSFQIRDEFGPEQTAEHLDRKQKLPATRNPVAPVGRDAAAGTEWVVYAKPPFGGPRQVLKYLARYTYQVAIFNQRLVSLEDGRVTFRWKNYARAGELATMTLPAQEFIRRFLLYVLPTGFVKIRHFGFLANRGRRDNLRLCRQLLAASSITPPRLVAHDSATNEPKANTVDRCPRCKVGSMRMLEILVPQAEATVRYDAISLRVLQMDTS